MSATGSSKDSAQEYRESDRGSQIIGRGSSSKERVQVKGQGQGQLSGAPEFGGAPPGDPSTLVEPPPKPAKWSWRWMLLKLFPPGYLGELKAVCKYSWKTILSSFFWFFQLAAVMGGIDTLDEIIQAILVLDLTVIYFLGFNFCNGATIVCDIYFSGAVATGHRDMLLILLLRCLFILTIFFLPMAAVLMNVGTLTLMLGGNSYMAYYMGEYAMQFIPGIYLMIWYLAISKFLQYQGYLISMAVISAIGVFFNLLFHFLFYKVFMLTDIIYSSISFALAFFFMILLQIAWILFRKLHRTCWNGMWIVAFLDWGQVLKVTFRGFLNLALIEYGFALPFILGITLGDAVQEAQTVIMFCSFIAFMLPIGLMIGVGVRVVQNLAKMRPIDPVLTYRVAVSLVLFTTVLFFILFTALRDIIPWMLATTQEAVDIAADVLPMTPLFLIFLGLPSLLNGALRNRTLVVMSLSIIFIGNYMIAMPIMIITVFVFDWGLIGIYGGFFFGLACQLVIYIVILVLTTWKSLNPPPAAPADVPLAEATPLTETESRPRAETAEERPPMAALMGRRKSRFLPNTEESYMLTESVSTLRRYNATENANQAAQQEDIDGYLSAVNGNIAAKGIEGAAPSEPAPDVPIVRKKTVRIQVERGSQSDVITPGAGGDFFTGESSSSALPTSAASGPEEASMAAPLPQNFLFNLILKRILLIALFIGILMIGVYIRLCSVTVGEGDQSRTLCIVQPRYDLNNSGLATTTLYTTNVSHSSITSILSTLVTSLFTSTTTETSTISTITTTTPEPTSTLVTATT